MSFSHQSHHGCPWQHPPPVPVSFRVFSPIGAWRWRLFNILNERLTFLFFLAELGLFFFVVTASLFSNRKQDNPFHQLFFFLPVYRFDVCHLRSSFVFISTHTSNFQWNIHARKSNVNIPGDFQTLFFSFEK
jgi:hypothetical protein